MPGAEFAIKNFDYHADQGVIPKNWRSKLRLEDARFGDVEKSVPALVFGSWERARLVGGYKWAGSLIEQGCLSTKFIGATELRKVWEAKLNTDPTWSYLEEFSTYTKKVKGITFNIIEGLNENVGLYNQNKLLKVYKNVASAKRAVRKMVQRGEI